MQLCRCRVSDLKCGLALGERLPRDDPGSHAVYHLPVGVSRWPSITRLQTRARAGGTSTIVCNGSVNSLEELLCPLYT
jgi:hypothetical protein